MHYDHDAHACMLGGGGHDAEPRQLPAAACVKQHAPGNSMRGQYTAPTV